MAVCKERKLPVTKQLPPVCLLTLVAGRTYDGCDWMSRPTGYGDKTVLNEYIRSVFHYFLHQNFSKFESTLRKKLCRSAFCKIWCVESLLFQMPKNAFPSAQYVIRAYQSLSLLCRSIHWHSPKFYGLLLYSKACYFQMWCVLLLCNNTNIFRMASGSKYPNIFVNNISVLQLGYGIHVLGNIST